MSTQEATDLETMSEFAFTVPCVGTDCENPAAVMVTFEDSLYDISHADWYPACTAHFDALSSGECQCKHCARILVVHDVTPLRKA